MGNGRVESLRVTLERLFKRPTWVLAGQTALVGCMREGCSEALEIPLPDTVNQARDLIKEQGWCFEATNGLHYCQTHAKEFFKMRTERAVATFRRNQKSPDKIAWLLRRPTWVLGKDFAAVQCMHEGCDQRISIRMPKTFEQAREAIKSYGWGFETVNGIHYCPKHTKEFYKRRADNAAVTRRKKKKATFPPADVQVTFSGAPDSYGPPNYSGEEALVPMFQPVPERQLSQSDQDHIAEAREEVKAKWPGLSPSDCDLVAGAVAEQKPPPPQTPPPIQPEPAHSPAASRGLRKMFGILDDYFETKRGRYLPGWSDERVARECDLAVSAVARYRDEAYGVLRTVDEQTLADIKRLDKALVDAQAQLDGYREQLAVIKGKVFE